MKMSASTVITILSLFQLVKCRSDCVRTDENVVDNLNISQFLDNNKLIRLNIHIGEPYQNSDTTSAVICIQGETCDFEECSHMSKLAAQNLIIPDMKLTNPFQKIDHCSYNISLSSIKWINYTCISKVQVVKYTVPDCVENVCKCPISPPANLTSIKKMPDENYEIRYETKTNHNTTDNIEVVAVYYKSKYSSEEVYFPRNDTFYDDSTNAIVLKGVTDYFNGEKQYEIFATFLKGRCEYNASIKFHEEQKSSTTIVYYVYFLLVLLILLVILTQWKAVSKLKNYLLLSSQHQICEIEQELPKTKEEYNIQYTPLEFILRAHEFDEYELPKNRIIIKEQIGKGAFGTVYYAKAYNMQNQSGHQLVAVKQLQADPCDEEIEAFKQEINILKKIQDYGGHPNIVRLLACVTMEQPYMMVMELVPHGALKDYLLKLKEEWNLKKESYPRYFFSE